MFTEKQRLLLTGLNAEREWVQSSLPIENSLIAFDLLLVIANTLFLEERNPTVKEFFASIHQYSYAAIRRHYLRFLDINLIELYGDADDKRIKYVRPTIKFADLLSDYLEIRNSLNSL